MIPKLPDWPTTDDPDVQTAIDRLRLLAGELLGANPELTVTGQLAEGNVPLLEVALGDRPLGEVHVVADAAADADRIYGLVGEFWDYHPEDFAGTCGEIVRRLLDMADSEGDAQE